MGVQGTNEPQHGAGAADATDEVPLVGAHSTNTTDAVLYDESGLGCYMDWGEGNGGHCLDCCNCSPCCGDPCSVSDGCYCFWCFLCCSCCVYGKMLASTTETPQCALVNHCGPFCLAVVINGIVEGSGSVLNCILHSVIRRNSRMRAGVGPAAFTLGDFCMVCCPCTAPCAMCQQLRSMPVSDWDWYAQYKTTGIPTMYDEWVFTYEPPAPGTKGNPTTMLMNHHA
eukprot:TRINITY_DN3481_c0_g1_i1.p1 TRINITY_DN3481_c0_g1~~TRINITY_DN3481_c0_g1_i1.p1  ORF type:complete len:243 (+),score=58.92 TRINITY_DN3481_c0_g1_i1:54-731(+)